MRAFILAAGEGTRMWPLTEKRPKPLIPLGNRPIIEHIMDAIVGAGLKKITILIGYEGRKIAEKYGYSYKGASVDYLYQEKRLGTGNAALYAERYNDDRFLFVNGDLFFSPDIIKEMLQYENAVLGVFKGDASHYGILFGDDTLEKIEEKVPGAHDAWINGGVYLLSRSIFSHLRKLKPSPRGELELTDALNMMARETDIKIVRSNGPWVDIGRPWDLLEATRIYLDSLDPINEGTIEDNVTIKGKVRVGKGTVIKSGTYIEGPVLIGENCVIGPNSYIRPYTVLGDNCHVGNFSEIKASVIMQGTKIPHFNYVGDSIIGENCNLGAGTKIANLRLDEKNVRVYVKGKLEDTGRRKLGVIMGDGVHTGINVSIDVGTVIGYGVHIAPGAVVRGVIGNNARIY